MGTLTLDMPEVINVMAVQRGFEAQLCDVALPPRIPGGVRPNEVSTTASRHIVCIIDNMQTSGHDFVSGNLNFM